MPKEDQVPSEILLLLMNLELRYFTKENGGELNIVLEL